MAEIVLTKYGAASFKSFLNELQASKIKDTEHRDQLMTALTMAAQENIRDCEVIVDIIREQLKIVCPASCILIVELIDSIILFVGDGYKSHFKRHSDQILAEAGKDADANVQLKLSEFRKQWNLLFSMDDESQAIDTIQSNESATVTQTGISDLFKQIDQINKRERALIADIKNNQVILPNHQHPQPEMNPPKKFKKCRPSKNLMQIQSSSIKVPAKRNNQPLAESSGISTPPPANQNIQKAADYIIPLWMNAQFNSLKEFKFYSENN